MEAGAESLAGFRSMGLTLVAFFTVNIAIFGIVSAYHPLLNALILAPDHPSGILTATFTHGDVSHLFGNMAVLAILGLFFVGVNMSADLETQKRLGKIFVLGSFLAGFAASAVQLVIWRFSGVSGIQACGASGMVYGAAGVLLASAFYNIPGCFSQIRLMLDGRFGIASPNIFYTISFSMCAATLFTYLAVFETRVFFYMETGVIWLVHELGFLFGFLASVLLFFALRKKAGKKS
jgi:membrane associated rhomboid family serine protease